MRDSDHKEFGFCSVDTKEWHQVDKRIYAKKTYNSYKGSKIIRDKSMKVKRWKFQRQK